MTVYQVFLVSKLEETYGYTYCPSGQSCVNEPIKLYNYVKEFLVKDQIYLQRQKKFGINKL